MRSRHVCRILVENEVLDLTFPYDEQGEVFPLLYEYPASSLSERHMCIYRLALYLY